MLQAPSLIAEMAAMRKRLEIAAKIAETDIRKFLLHARPAGDQESRTLP